MKKLSLCLLLIGSLPMAAFAGRYQTPALTSWSMYMNNGVVYISSSQMPSHCTYSRAQINMSGTEFDRTQIAMALAAYKSKSNIAVFIDSDHTVCVMSGIYDYN